MSLLLRRALSAFSIVMVTMAGFSAGAQFTAPALREPVQDMAGVLDASTKADLERQIRAAHETGRIQLQILIVPTLNGEPVESAALKVAEAWGLGTTKGDQGALFLVAVKDRKMRIEVGQGLEGDIPDVIAKRILADRVAPYFRAGDYSGGIREGTRLILAAAGAGDGTDAGAVPFEDSGMSERTSQYIHLGIFLLFIIFSLMSRFTRRRRGGLAPFLGGYYLGSGGFRGGGSGFGGSSGGWSGGGGGFSGGGASSDW